MKAGNIRSRDLTIGRRNRGNSLPSLPASKPRFIKSPIMAMIVVILTMWLWLFPQSVEAEDSIWRQQTLMFLGTTLDKNHQPVGCWPS